MIDPYKVIKKLDFERLAGTEGEKKAIQVIGSHIKNLGLDYKLEPFEIVSFSPGSATLTVAGKQFTGNPFGLNEDANVTGEFVFLDNWEVLLYNLGAFRNKIIVSYGFSRKLASALKKQEAAAYIAIGTPARKASSLSHRQNTFKEGYVPCMTVDHITGEKLVKYSGKEAGVVIKQKVEKKTSHNIVVDIPGKGADKNLTLSGAHYDSVARCNGSSDNAGGSVTLLKVAEHFAKHQPARDLRLIFFGAEELGLLGSSAFVKAHKEELAERVPFLLNIDVAGDPVGFDTAMVLGTKELLGYVDGISKEIGVAFRTRLGIYSSDGMPFSVQEIPSVSLSRRGGRANFYIHTSDDTPKLVTKKAFENTVKSAINILSRVLNAKIYPIKKEIDPDLRDDIEKYVWNSTMAKPELNWEPKYKK
jgi:aminopeptidase YwaD